MDYVLHGVAIPIKSLGCWAKALEPASPTMPMLNPATRPDNPTLRPEAKCMKESLRDMTASTGIMREVISCGVSKGERGTPGLSKPLFDTKTATTRP